MAFRTHSFPPFSFHLPWRWLCPQLLFSQLKVCSLTPVIIFKGRSGQNPSSPPSIPPFLSLPLSLHLFIPLLSPSLLSFLCKTPDICFVLFFNFGARNLKSWPHLYLLGENIFPRSPRELSLIGQHHVICPTDTWGARWQKTMMDFINIRLLENYEGIALPEHMVPSTSALINVETGECVQLLNKQ